MFPLQGVAAEPAASLDLLRRATDPNPTLKSYTASAQMSAVMRSPLPARKTFSGSVYYLKPRRKVEFQGVSGPLSRFKDLAASTPTFVQAAAQYTIAPLTNNGSVSSYLLTPKDAGARVKSLKVDVDDNSALIVHVEWVYTDGGRLSLDETYVDVSGFHLPSEAKIVARFPHYAVDGTLRFSDYQPNATVAPSVFATPK